MPSSNLVIALASDDDESHISSVGAAGTLTTGRDWWTAASGAWLTCDGKPMDVHWLLEVQAVARLGDESR